MANYKIGLHGCDDSTYIFMDLTEEQLKLVEEMKRLAGESSNYGCMPTMTVDKVE